jgi:undecaprenyl pyrophosphate phosphatase UppP
LRLYDGDPTLVIPVLLYVHLGTVIAAPFYFRSELTSIYHEIACNSLDIQHHASGKSGFIFVALLFTGIIGIPLLVAEKELFPALDASLLYALMGAGLFVTGFFSVS